MENNLAASADPEGGTGGQDPPWDLSEVGSCVEAWWVGKGVQLLFYLIIINFFWLASLASIIQIYYMYTYFKVQCSVWNGHPFSIFPLSKSWKESNFPSLSCFYQRTFLFFSCLELHDFTPIKTTFFWGRTINPPPRHIYNIKTIPCPLCVCIERGLQLYKRPCPIENRLVCK